MFFRMFAMVDAWIEISLAAKLSRKSGMKFSTLACLLVGFMLTACGAEPAPTPRACTPQTPCRIRVLFTATENGLRSLKSPSEAAGCRASGDPRLCLLHRVAADNVAILRRAFVRSGITDVVAGRPSLLFDYAVANRPIDAGVAEPVDGASVGFDDFNPRLLGQLSDLRASRGGGAQIVVGACAR